MTVVVLGAVCHILQQHRASRAGQRGAETRQGAVKILDIKIINQFAIQLNDFERIISWLPAKSALLPGRLQTPLWRRPRSASWRSCWSRIVWELSRQQLCYRSDAWFTMDLIKKNFNLKLWIQYKYFQSKSYLFKFNLNIKVVVFFITFYLNPGHYGALVSLGFALTRLLIWW